MVSTMELKMSGETPNTLDNFCYLGDVWGGCSGNIVLGFQNEGPGVLHMTCVRSCLFI